MAGLKGTSGNIENNIGYAKLYSQANDKKAFDQNFVSQIPLKNEKTAQAQHDLEKPIWVGGKVQKSLFAGPGNLQQVAIIRGTDGVFVVKGSIPLVSLNTKEAKTAIKNARLLVTSGYFEQRTGGQALALKYNGKLVSKATKSGTSKPSSLADVVRVDLDKGNTLVGKQILETKGKLTRNVELYSNGKNYIIPVEDVNGGRSGIVLKAQVGKSSPESLLSEIKQLSNIVKVKTYSWPVVKPVTLNINAQPKVGVVKPAKSTNIVSSDKIIDILPETKVARFELGKKGNEITVVQLYEHKGKFVVPLDAKNVKGLILNSNTANGFNASLRKEINDKLKTINIKTIEVLNEKKAVGGAIFNVGQGKSSGSFTTPVKEPS